MDPLHTFYGNDAIVEQLYGEDTVIIHKDDERGSVPMALIIIVALFVIIGGGMAVCGDALFEDEDEANDLGHRIELVGDYYDDDDYGGGDNRRDDSGDGSGECRGSSGPCSDDDLSPSFDESPVWICLPGSTCHGPQTERISV